MIADCCGTDLTATGRKDSEVKLADVIKHMREKS